MLVLYFSLRANLSLCFNESSDSETRSCLGGQVFCYCFNEFNNKDNSVVFMFREFEKGRKENSIILFSSNNPLGMKKNKII